MERRIEFQIILEELLGSRNVYFQPPSNVQLKYPCIIYHRDDVEEYYANNKLYIGKKRYELTIIDEDPDSIIPDKVAQLELSSFTRHFVSDNLNHDIYAVYY